MCPEFEMHQREYQNNVEKWEIVPHPSKGFHLLTRQDPSTGRISKSYAVKAFHRPAAGNEQPLPSDVRPPPILVVFNSLRHLLTLFRRKHSTIYLALYWKGETIYIPHMLSFAIVLVLYGKISLCKIIAEKKPSIVMSG